MKIAILGYGKEGKSAEAYFKQQNSDIKILDNFTIDELKDTDFSSYDLVLRSPSVAPLGFDPTSAENPDYHWSSMTSYFFEHCPCEIIGITGTKGKGTTCSILTKVLETLGKKVWLVGNIGNPALDVLDQIQPDDVVVYEMSSFQLWDLEKSPHIAVVLRIEPDHLNVHRDFAEYVAAKANITKHQSASDACIYYRHNPESAKIASQSSGEKLPYPVEETNDTLKSILDSLKVPGAHNRENAEAALLAAAAYYDEDFESFIMENQKQLQEALSNFQGLPHRLELLRELNHVKYYDDNFSTTLPSTKVALEAFPDIPIVLIAGGRDKTADADLPEIAAMIQKYANFAILIGESGHELAKILPADTYQVAESLSEAVDLARDKAEKLTTNNNSVVLMSPAAASFDMFENVYDRGAQFQKLVQELV